jgi:hypothetical protein
MPIAFYHASTTDGGEAIDRSQLAGLVAVVEWARGIELDVADSGSFWLSPDLIL